VNSSTCLNALRGGKLLLCLALAFFRSFVVIGCKGNANDQSAEALHKLEDGNRRFVEKKTLCSRCRCGTSQRNRPEWSASVLPQWSHVLIPDCRWKSSSIKGSENLFVIRVAGNVCNVDEIGSAEYGADHLGTPVLVVLGHTKCGAVTAVVDGAELHGNIPLWFTESFPPGEGEAKPSRCQGDALVAAAIESQRLAIHRRFI